MLLTRSSVWSLFLLAVVGLGGALVAGYGSYAVARSAAREQIFSSNLALARTLGLPMQFPETPRPEHLLQAWDRVGGSSSESYLCVIGRDGVLQLNTKRPEKVGADVSAVPVAGGGARTVGDLAREARDWVGVNTNFSGVSQLAAYAYSEPLDAVVAVHLPEAVLAREIDARVRPWALAGGLSGLVLLPLAFFSLWGLVQSSRRQILGQEQRVAELQARVVELQRFESLDAVTSGVTHDLRGVLQGILASAELALDDLRRGERPGAELRSIEAAIEHADELLGRLRDASRPTSVDTPETADVAKAAQDALRMLHACTPRHVDLDARVEDRLPPASLSQVRLQQVLMNLSLNALHAMQDFGGSLLITAETAGADRIRISVADTGHGMDEATLARIFEPHFTTRTGQGGSGLGLAVVDEIARAAGGSVEVTSAPAEGTTFVVYLPAAAPESIRAMTEATPSTARAQPPLSGTARSPRS